MKSHFKFPDKIGLGTWRMGESENSKLEEINAIEEAIRVGYQVIDTAEMYANGGAEVLIGKTIKNLGYSCRDKLTLVSKVLPHNASKNGVIKACEASIKRLGCEYLDLYLLHWRGQYPFESTLEGFQNLKERGLIKHHGVSNFDVHDLKEWTAAEQSFGLQRTNGLATNQVFYALNARGVEFDLIPKLREDKVSLMAYSPLGGGDLIRHKKLQGLASTQGLSAAQLALAWVIRQENTVAIPKSVSKLRIKENWSCKDLTLSTDTLLALDQIFTPPRAKTSLSVI